MPAQDVAIGIDLGTTNSSIAVCYKDGRVVVIPNDQTGSRLTPSYVAFDEGTHTVGERAKESPHENAKNTIFQMKRIIGRKYGDAEVVRNKELWPFQLRCGEDGHTPMVVINDLDEEMLLSPVAICALVLKSLKSSAEAFLGQPIDQVVITVPARFTDAQRKATKEAGAQAGLNVIGMINEPTAAAIGYEIEGNESQTFLVFDFGGGTLDVSVLQSTEQSSFRVLATEGDMELGGADFDNKLLRHYIDRFREQHGINLREQPPALARLRLMCEKVKNNLSGRSDSYLASLAYITGAINFKERTTRTEFEIITDQLFQRMLNPVKSALRAAGKDKSDMDFVLLVGGCSRIPKVRQTLEAFFVDVPIKCDAFTDEAIAMGAAVYARSVMQKLAGLPSKYKVFDITPFTLGVGVAQGKVVPLIAKGTPIPVQERKPFTTQRRDQASAMVRIYEGESELSAENRLVGVVHLSDLQTGPGDQPHIVITFAYDESGVLNVTATERENETGITLSLH